MRKLQAGAAPAAEQTNPGHVSKQPGREWPRWKRIVAIAAVAGGALTAGSCKPLEKNDSVQRDPEMACLVSEPSFSSEEILADPQKRESVVRWFEENPQCNRLPYRSVSENLSKLAAVAANENTDHSTRERIIGILERAAYIGHDFALIANADPSSTERILSIMEKHLAAFALAELATDARTSPVLRQRIVEILERNGDLPELIDIALDKVAEPELKKRVLRLLDVACEEGTSLRGRAAISQIAGRIADGETEPRLQEIVDWLAGMVNDSESCANIVSGDSCKTAISALVFIATYEETEPWLKESILAELGNSNAFSSLADVAANENTEPYLRKRILKMFERALGDSREGVPQSAVDATEGLGPLRRQVDILEIASAHRMWDVRLRAMEILRVLAGDEIEPWLRTRMANMAARALRDSNEEVKEEARSVLITNLTANGADAELIKRILGMLERARIFPTGLLAERFVDFQLKEMILEMLERASANPNRDVRLKAVEELAWIVTPIVTGSSGPSCSGLYGGELWQCGAMQSPIYNSRGIESGLITRALGRLTEIADNEAETDEIRSAADGAITGYLMRMPSSPLSL